MRNKHIPHGIPFSQLRTGMPTYVNPSVFGLEHEHAWEAAKLTQTSPKRKTAQIIYSSKRHAACTPLHRHCTNDRSTEICICPGGLKIRFMQQDQENKVTEDDYMSEIIATMKDRHQDPEWTFLGDQLHADRMEGRTFADMMEQICLFKRIDTSRDMVLASLATQGMAQGSHLSSTLPT